ncbi:hypothetical protein HDU98_002804 [Podochytrium sp. JEL0797]|nr:hypothetical protein HDU98_002804 [Podochytrium sp. JEL0797]
MASKLLKKHSGLQTDVLHIYRHLLKTATSAIHSTLASAPASTPASSIEQKLNVYAAIRSEFTANKLKYATTSHAAIEHLVRKGKRSLEMIQRLGVGMDGISMPRVEGNATGRKKWGQYML